MATVEHGRFFRLNADPAHPTGQALYAKGRAAPELVYAPERLTHPLRRTRPKGDPDPGWQRITWDEALDTVAAAMRDIAQRHGPDAFAFTWASPSTTPIGESTGFLRRLMNGFGTPNGGTSLAVCGRGCFYATSFDQAIGRSRGGLSTEIHTLVDALGNPVAFHLTGGQARDLARHLIENFFAKLKQFRGIATRYDKTRRSFLAGVHLAAAVILLN